MAGDVPALVGGTLIGVVASSLFILVLLAGFCLLFGLPKLRQSGHGSRVVRTLDEQLGGTATYRPASTPRGPIDQLHTPELNEKARGSAA